MRRTTLIFTCVVATLTAAANLAYAQQPAEPPDQEQPAPLDEAPAAPQDEPEADEAPATDDGDDSETMSVEADEPPDAPDPRREELERWRKQRFEQLVQGFKRPPQTPKTPTTYFTVEDAAKAPRLDYYKPIICAYRPNSGIVVHLQCDPEQRTCLVAESAVFAPAVPAPGEKSPTTPTLQPTNIEPSHTRPCYQVVEAEAFEELRQNGYKLIPALLETPYGYKRDELHRTLQTHFDLRSRLLLGVHYEGLLDGGTWRNSLRVETRSSYEHWSNYNQRRHRFRFIEGELSLANLRAQATVFEYDYGRTSDEPVLFIGTMLGEPQRYDVKLSLGMGTTLGRLDYRTINAQSQVFIDLLEGRLNWEILQGTALEDYLMVRLGVGFGTRRYSDTPADPLYLYPELGVKSAWLIGARGLAQLSLDARVRYGWEPDSNANWTLAEAKASGELILITISDQPLSAFVQPEYTILDLHAPSGDVSQREFRLISGLRLSLFVPPPPRPRPSDGALRDRELDEDY